MDIIEEGYSYAPNHWFVCTARVQDGGIFIESQSWWEPQPCGGCDFRMATTAPVNVAAIRRKNKVAGPFDFRGISDAPARP